MNEAAAAVEHRVMNDGRCEIPTSELGQWIAEELGKIHEVARLRFEFEWRHPQDVSDCIVILLNYMERNARK
jgi:transcriptional regulator NrdR family protein